MLGAAIITGALDKHTVVAPAVQVTSMCKQTEVLEAQLREVRQQLRAAMQVRRGQPLEAIHNP